MRCKYCQKYPCNKVQIVRNHLEDIEDIINMNIMMAGCDEFETLTVYKGDGL